MKSFRDFLERINLIESEEHILKKNSNNKQYLEKMYEMLLVLKDKISDKEFDDIIDNKLLFKQKFNINSYMQGMVEFVVNSSCCFMYPEKFEYEKKYNLDKNVDCSFEFNSIKEAIRKINVEVKCPEYGENENKTLITLNRVEKEKFKELVNNPEWKKRRDLKLKDYLESGQSKFINSPEDHINILLICLDNEIDLLEWIYYLIATKDGMIRKPEVYEMNFKDFDRVDAVFITDLYIRHKQAEKNYCMLGECYTFGVINEESLLNKIHKINYLTEKENFFKNSTLEQKYNFIIISEIFNNLMLEFIEYESGLSNDIDKAKSLFEFIKYKDFSLSN